MYVERASPDLINMTSNVAAFVINSPNQSVRTDEETGRVTSTGPKDINNMITQYVDHSSKVEEFNELKGRVLIMVTNGTYLQINKMQFV